MGASSDGSEEWVLEGSMDLFSGELPALKDIGVAKTYLKEDELKVLNNLVSGYFDLAYAQWH